MMIRRLALLALFAAAPLAIPEAASQNLDQRLDDARLAASVQTALAQDAVLQPYLVRVQLRDGAMVVEGTVATAAEARRVAEVVAEAAPGRTARNEVTVSDTARRQRGPLPPRLGARQAASPAPEAAASRNEQQQPRTAARDEAVYHVVRSGDTLGAIARRHGVSVSEIQRLNGIRGTNIRPGQRLRVK